MRGAPFIGRPVPARCTLYATRPGGWVPVRRPGSDAAGARQSFSGSRPQHPVWRGVRSTSRPKSGRSRVPMTLPAKAMAIQTQPCRLPEAMPEK